MAKHLSKVDIKNIKNIIQTWKEKDEKLTWENLCLIIHTILKRSITRQTLHTHEDIVEAFKIKKKLITSKKAVLKKPANLAIAAQRIENLKIENEILRAENRMFKEQFTVWQYNAYVNGITKEQLNRPLNKK
ncbi:hypothetical protein M5Q92_002997 [Salmonella enterica]|nr:hypothetical protein [Salmonella enterica subsp. diarizonae]EDJ1091593.1 hypothetical protein [Salmonella enterica]EGP4106382.1 hypothetical protein [Salmonella enterica]EGU7234469.1 hypothetical protein [Salmonella enterica]EHB9739697.1 hypothetical protein [Salmonella enterica]